MGGRLGGRKHVSELLGVGSDNSMGQGELDLRVMELQRAGSLAVLGGNRGSANNLDGSATSAVTTSHVIVCGNDIKISFLRRGGRRRGGVGKD